jgi:hypothetical protein
MGRSIWALIRRVTRSGLSQVLLILSTCLILLEWHHIPEPLLVNCDVAEELGFIPMADHRILPIYFLVNLPSLLITAGVTKFFKEVFMMSCASTAKLETVLLVTFCSIQWMLIGYGVETFFRRRRLMREARPTKPCS